MSARAKKLIAENIAKRERGENATYLELGNCGLTEWPDLSQLHWLRTLIVSNEWHEKGKPEVIASAGATFQSNSLQIDFTPGEVAVTTL